MWPGYVAIGKLAIIMGDPGLGKSLMALDLAARISNGAAIPVHGSSYSKGDVLLFSNEDAPDDTIRPRLDAAKADSKKIYLLSMINEKSRAKGRVNARMFSLKKDLIELEKFLTEHPERKLVVIDPLSAYLGGANGHKDDEVRGVLTPLAVLAQKYKVAIVGIMHLNKGEQRSSLNRMSGSTAFGAVARSVMAVVRDKENSERRLVLPVKNNLADDGKGLAYSLHVENETVSIIWEDQFVTASVDAYFTHEKKDRAHEVNEAVSWLKTILKDGGLSSKEVAMLGEENGFSLASLRRAKDKAGIITKRKGYGSEGAWWCELPSKVDNVKDAQES